MKHSNISFCQFCDEFRDMGRQDQFTYEGKRALYDYLEEYEADTGEELELDVIALCCEYSEEPLSSVLENYRLDSIEELRDNTTVVDFDEKTGLVVYGVY